MRIQFKILIGVSLIGGIAFIFILNAYMGPTFIARNNQVFGDYETLFASVRSSKQQRSIEPIATPPHATTSFTDTFNTSSTVQESGELSNSTNPNWWISSGAYFYSASGVGSTIQGSLSILNPWRVAFSLSNPLDTDNGYHPQNIFRLVSTNSKWQNFRQEAYFQIVQNNLSGSPNRNASNGLLFFNRYQDAYNLYYTGIRVDGAIVIKKKMNGTYYTLAYKPFYIGPLVYNRDTTPNLIPNNQWVGLRSEVRTNPDNTVNIKIYIDKNKTGNWILAADATDDNKTYGGNAIVNEGYAGLRTDFMDVLFDDYKITGL